MNMEKSEKIVLVGEPMGLFMAEEEGELKDVKRFSASIAGAEYNVAVGLSRLGHKALFCTRIGEDPFGEKILDGMRSNGISDELVMKSDSELTGFMLKGSTSKGDPKIAYFRKNSAASKITAHDMDTLDLSGCGFLHVTGIFPAVSESAFSAVKRLIARAQALDMKISFDPNLRPQLWQSKEKMISALNSLASCAQTVLPGLGEGRLLTKEDTPEGIAEYYQKIGAQNVVVKLGKDGAFYSQKNGQSGYILAFPESKKVDTVGAGDGFAAGVVSALAEGLSLEEAAFRGNVIGAVQITNKSDNEGLPTKEELEKIIARGFA